MFVFSRLKHAAWSQTPETTHKSQQSLKLALRLFRIRCRLQTMNVSERSSFRLVPCEVVSCGLMARGGWPSCLCPLGSVASYILSLASAPFTLGVWTLDYGLWTMDYGLCLFATGERSRSTDSAPLCSAKCQVPTVMSDVVGCFITDMYETLVSAYSVSHQISD